MKVKRESLLHQLELVSPGLSPRDLIEQSASVAFLDGKMLTFNDEVACSLKCDLRIDRASVRADPLMAILRKMPDEYVEVKTTDSHLKLRGTRRGAEILLDELTDATADNLLSVDKPKKWQRVPSKLVKALSMVKECVSRDQSKTLITHVHIAPDRVESTDNYRASRYSLRTRFAEPVLIKRESAATIESLGVNKFSESEAWIHFQNDDGLKIACRRYADKFPNLDPFLEVEGTETNLPSGLDKICERAEVFSATNPEDNLVKVSITRGKIKVVGEGVYGRFYEDRKLTDRFEEEIHFLIPPSLLAIIGKRHNKCVISDDKLKVEDGKFAYVVALGEEE
jgi:DNA polymerase III sliding clamp (beta) subunit (PCNA family)